MLIFIFTRHQTTISLMMLFLSFITYLSTIFLFSTDSIFKLYSMFVLFPFSMIVKHFG